MRFFLPLLLVFRTTLYSVKFRLLNWWWLVTILYKKRLCSYWTPYEFSTTQVLLILFFQPLFLRNLGKVNLNFFFGILGHLNNLSIPSHTYIFSFLKGSPKIYNNYHYLPWCWVPSFPLLSIHSMTTSECFCPGMVLAEGQITQPLVSLVWVVYRNFEECLRIP